MRWIVGLVALGLAAPAVGETGVAVHSAVFVEHGTTRGTTIQPAAQFARGDSVVTVMTWQAAQRDPHTIVSAVPSGLELESLSRDGVELSTDGGRNWQTVEAGEGLPRGVTHLRWRTGGSGRLSYRAVVR